MKTGIRRRWFVALLVLLVMCVFGAWYVSEQLLSFISLLDSNVVHEGEQDTVGWYGKRHSDYLCRPDSKLRARSYQLPDFFPFPPLRMVLETRPGTCDLFESTDICKSFSDGTHFEPEYHIREAIASFLIGCQSRRCNALDLGANIGYFTTYMASLGAYVKAVEPVPEQARIVRETSLVNCFEDRVEVIQGGASPHPKDKGTKLKLNKGWRMEVYPPGKNVPKHPFIMTKDFEVEVTTLDELLTEHHYDFVKIDTDGPDGAFLTRLEELIALGNVSVDTIVIEFNAGENEALWKMQLKHGYDLYKLDMGDDRRFINAKGVDVYSGFGHIDIDDSMFEERYHQRFMRHLYYVKRVADKVKFIANINKKRGRVVDANSGRIKSFPNQFLLTKIKLLEPRWEHPHSIRWPSKERMKSGYKPNKNGLS